MVRQYIIEEHRAWIHHLEKIIVLKYIPIYIKSIKNKDKMQLFCKELKCC